MTTTTTTVRRKDRQTFALLAAKKDYGYEASDLGGRLGRQDDVGIFVEQETGAAVGFDGVAGALGEGVGLDGEVLGEGGRGFFAADDLDDLAVLVLRRVAVLREAFVRDVVGVRQRGEFVEPDEAVGRVLVARARGSAHELGQAPVQRGLPAFEARSLRPAASGLLTAHPEAARRALARRVPAALARPSLFRAGGASDVIDAELLRIETDQMRLVRLSPLPVVELHRDHRRLSLNHDARQRSCGHQRLHA
eukprot:CAMPEP_0198662380 /NCGR_PEP_ID=MMETSP1467-20131203/47159_1 /TAXON_ID=1462469 /ORGANISM="unid. sp., Strain CCMP2135" /LENGTH=249 /DNA_ID=CAMNT_0044398865 /DNA_START=138 /DNA_END=885 /DNA_ORIENTATION=-